MPSAIFSVGVDLGGTWIRLQAVDKAGHPLRSFKAPAPSVDHAPLFIKKCLLQWKIRPQHLSVASRGVWSPAERKHLQRALKGLAQRVRVMSDVEAAWYAAFTPGIPGVVVIAGTGSIGYGRDAKNGVLRSGGWGPLLGDEGSAFWIGKTWLKQTHRNDAIHNVLKLVRHSDKAVRRIAALTPGILKRAQRGHSTAKLVVAYAQTHLAELAAEVAHGLHLKNPIAVSWAGSLLENESFRAGFSKALHQKSDRNKPRFHLTPPRMAPELAVGRLFLHGR